MVDFNSKELEINFKYNEKNLKICQNNMMKALKNPGVLSTRKSENPDNGNGEILPNCLFYLVGSKCGSRGH